MAYSIKKTDGSSLGTIADGTVDNKSRTSLILIGRNYSNYGEFMLWNMVGMLENFADTSSPLNPQIGQLWYDKNSNVNRLKVYNGAAGFKSLAYSVSSSSFPTTGVISGDLWWDSVNKQLYVHDGSTPVADGWKLIGPQRNNSGALWEQITANTGVTHDVVSMYLNGTRVGIFSKSTVFTPLNPILGFTTVSPGYNQNSAGIISGTTTNAQKLDNIDAANYLRSDINETTVGSFAIQNNNGLTIGLNNNLQITTTSLGGAVLKNAINEGDLNLVVTTSGSDNNAIQIDGATGKTTAIELSLIGATESTSITTGALTVAGGLGISKRLNVAGDANFQSLVFTTTAPVGTANTMVATTEFVVNNSGFLKNKIYTGSNAALSTTFIAVNAGPASNLIMQVDGVSVATASAVGFNLANGATAVTQPDTYDGLGNAKIATTQFVKNATQWWGGSKKYVSSVPPVAGVNDIGSVDGDFWFQYIP